MNKLNFGTGSASRVFRKSCTGWTSDLSRRSCAAVSSVRGLFVFLTSVLSEKTTSIGVGEMNLAQMD